MGNSLKKFRLENNVDITTIMNIWNLKTKAAYYKKENGSVNITLEEARKASRYFRKTIEDIFFAE